MKNILIIGLSAFLLSGCIGAGSNTDFTMTKDNYFPQMTGIDLFGEDRTVPDTFEGELNIVAVAFQQEQQVDVNTWIAIADEIMAENSAVRFYEIPVIFKANALFRTWVNNGMRSGIPSDIARERTITVYTDREQFVTDMEMDFEQITLLITDKKGRILWRTDGPATPDKEQNVRTFIAGRSS